MSHHQTEPWEQWRWYSFERNSRLPLGAFDPPRRWHIVGVVAAALALAILVACAAM
jgi:hypothetical protein